MDPALSLPANLVGAISPPTAHALSFIFTTSYVGSLYLSQTLFQPRSPARSSPLTPHSTGPPGPDEHDGKAPAIPPIASEALELDEVFSSRHEPPVGSRDHPATMKRRMKAVSISTILSLSGVFLTIRNISPSSSTAGLAVRLLGLRLPSTFEWRPYALAPVLMLGPLVAMALEGDLPLIGGRRIGETIWERIKRAYREAGLIELRNYVVGPVTEELVFRSTILAISILGGLSFNSLVFGTPLWFGIAHAHHALESYRKNGSTSSAAVHALIGCLFQLSYTTLFGWFASYLFLRTGSILPPLLSHTFCNIMGIYLPSSAISRYPRSKTLVWGSYLAGIVGFVVALRGY